MKRIEYFRVYNPNSPVLIYKINHLPGGAKEVTGVINSNGILDVGDIIQSPHIGAVDNNYSWCVKEILERFDPKGHFIIDMKGCGFKAIVELR